ncbi:hypothetical protein AVEN_8274-1 [Araneus ventricosus]|uniref:RNase H type-1 domain-containing protein n=1 Tax=Araneus ventricosus TaxID=182803 RepID=A0A4Y2FAG3_ARAVE|nr:hypothetical protein AVEN_8274-1 [Araneus ventricosus]
MAIEAASFLHRPIKIWTDSLSSLMTILNPKSHYSMVREIQTLLLSHKHIHLRWLKALVGYLGNECADQLAKQAITKGDTFFLPKPLSYLKYEIRSAALSIWQDNWDNGETGRGTHDIVPRVSNMPVRWNREEIMFVTGYGKRNSPASIQTGKEPNGSKHGDAGHSEALELLEEVLSEQKSASLESPIHTLLDVQMLATFSKSESPTRRTLGIEDFPPLQAAYRRWLNHTEKEKVQESRP